MKTKEDLIVRLRRENRELKVLAGRQAIIIGGLNMDIQSLRNKIQEDI